MYQARREHVVTPARTIRRTALLWLLPALILTGCVAAGPAPAEPSLPGPARSFNLGPEQHRVRAQRVDELARRVPLSVRERGELVVGMVPAAGGPPLAFVADDEKTVIGVETDIAQLVADVLGLRLVLRQTSWEDLFLGVRTGKIDVGFNNITVTEERKDLYDFATYRVDQLAWEVARDSPIRQIGKPADAAGLRVAVMSGTTQEKVLLAWDRENRAAGRPALTLLNFTKAADHYLALRSGRIDAYFGSHPSIVYHVAAIGETRIAGRADGGGTLPARVAAMTRKGDGLAPPIAGAVNAVIADGSYGAALDRWQLREEAVSRSEINPPGLPREG
jgi:polar amino acid transport system substrate-binding protein